MLKDKLAELVRPVVDGLGYELWDIEYSQRRGNGFLRLYIDRPAGGISLVDCERVSRAVSALLDVEDPLPGQYTLEVSSPGIERPLSTAAHFAAYIGEPAVVEIRQPIDGQRRFKGVLRKAGAELIEMEVEGRSCVLPISDIRKAHLAPED